MTARSSWLTFGLALLLTWGCAPTHESDTRIYVSNETGGEIVVVDPDAAVVVSRIPVGKRPRGILLTADGTRLLVALSGSPIAGPGVDESTLPPADREADGIGVVDVANGRLLTRYPSGQDPEAFDVSPDGRRLYVSNEETAEVTVLDLERGDIIRRVGVGEEPEGVTVRPDGRVVYVACEADNIVTAIDTSSLEVIARIPTGPRPRMIAFSRDGALGFVTAENDAAVHVFDTASHAAVARIEIPRSDEAPMPARPMHVVLSPDGESVYVSNGRGQSVGVIDVNSRQVIRLIEDVGTRPWGMGVSGEGRFLYTANGPSGDVSIIDLESGDIRRVQVGGSPWGIAVGSTARGVR